MTSIHESVVDFLRAKKVPVSLTTISKRLGLKKRPVLAVCHQDPEITKVHPSHCGSGKEKASLFVLSSDEEWIVTKSFN